MTTPAIMDLIDPIIVDEIRYETAFPNQEFDPSQHDRYIKVSYLESRSEAESYGSDRVPSILQIDRCVRADTGARDEIINEILDAFPKGRKIANSSARIRVDRAPTVSPSFNVNGWYITPVTIPYEVFR